MRRWKRIHRRPSFDDMLSARKPLGDLAFRCMGKNSPPREEVYAVVRVDSPVDGPDHEHRITVKEIVRSREIALAEVERLNALNADKGCWYFCHMTRLFADGESFGTHSDGESTVA